MAAISVSDCNGGSRTVVRAATFGFISSDQPKRKKMFSIMKTLQHLCLLLLLEVEFKRVLQKVFDALERNGVGQNLEGRIRIDFLRVFLQNADHHIVIRHQAAGMQRYVAVRWSRRRCENDFHQRHVHITMLLIFGVIHVVTHPTGKLKYQLFVLRSKLLQVLHSSIVSDQRRTRKLGLSLEQLQGTLVLTLGLVENDQFHVRKQTYHIDRIGIELSEFLHRLPKVLVHEQVP
uniref:Uncharacterized protein n=1 Tax=Anopheles farauti TaxID=69004 RepID=A0A182QTC9_9DIPT